MAWLQCLLRPLIVTLANVTIGTSLWWQLLRWQSLWTPVLPWWLSLRWSSPWLPFTKTADTPSSPHFPPRPHHPRHPVTLWPPPRIDTLTVKTKTHPTWLSKQGMRWGMGCLRTQEGRREEAIQRSRRNVPERLTLTLSGGVAKCVC